MEVYYLYHLPPIYFGFGHSYGNIQGGTLQKIDELRCYTF